MPRRGWQTIEVPSGWYEVIRGPRPPSQKWPIASSRQPAQFSRKPQIDSGPPVRQGGRWGHRRGVWSVGRRQECAQPERVRTSREVILCTTRQRVAQLEAALAAPGDTSGPVVILLQNSLKSAKRAASGAASGRPGEPVRTVRCQSPEEVGDTRRGEGPSGFRVGGRRKSARKIARGSHSSQGCPCATDCSSPGEESTSCSPRGDGAGSPR